MSHGGGRANRKTVVLLGIGHTNAHVVKQWAKDPIPDCDLVCISKFPFATYSGMLPGTLGLQFRDEEMRIDLKALAIRANAKLVLADTCGLDCNHGMIHFSDHEPIHFDALSIGVGSMPAGWQEHADSPLLVPTKPMQTFLDRLHTQLSCTRRTKGEPRNVAIVGGGVASVEIAFCLQEMVNKSDFSSDVAITVYTSSDRIADGMRNHSTSRIESLLVKRSISVHCGQRVTSVNKTTITTADGVNHSADCVIWATGAAPPPVLGKLGLESDDNGFIATSPSLQSLSDARIFAVGDCGTVMETPSPKAGVYAVRQCPILWHNLRAFLSGKPLTLFEPQSDFLKLLNTGDGKAFLQYGWFSAHARWCSMLKTWIDKRFIREFQNAGAH